MVGQDCDPTSQELLKCPMPVVVVGVRRHVLAFEAPGAENKTLKRMHRTVHIECPEETAKKGAVA